VQLWHDDDIRRSQTIGNRVAVATFALLSSAAPWRASRNARPERRLSSTLSCPSVTGSKARPRCWRRNSWKENRFGASSKF